ncbi:hypothetical protein BN1013_02086 [Candidatus Rubidus massiliensis]|nr:hypothetical protein BN1013_02086 [Candidatus Rubidus massiliensis]
MEPLDLTTTPQCLIIPPNLESNALTLFELSSDSVVDKRMSQALRIGLKTTFQEDYPLYFAITEVLEKGEIIEETFFKDIYFNQKIFNFFPNNASIKVIGGYCLYLLEHSLKGIFKKLSFEVEIDDFKPAHKYADIDLRFEFFSLSKDAVSHYLKTCYQVGYKPKKIDVSLPQEMIPYFKACYLEIFKQKCPFEISYQNDCYLHIVIDVFDISYTFSSNRPLFTLDAVSFVVKEKALFVETTMHVLLHASIAVFTKNLKVVADQNGNAKSFWKLWHLQTKGYRSLDLEGYKSLKLKSLARLEGESWVSAIDLIKNLSQVHANEDINYSYAIFTYLYYSNLLDLQKLSIIKNSIGFKVTSYSIFQELMVYKEDVKDFFTILSFTALCGLLCENPFVKCTLINHQNGLSIQVTDEYSILIPYHLEEICQNFLELVERQKGATTLSLLKRLAPLDKANANAFREKVAQKLLSLGLTLKTKPQWKEVSLYLCLLCYHKSIDSIAHEFIEAIPELLFFSSKLEKAVFVDHLHAIFIKLLPELSLEHWVFSLLKSDLPLSALRLGFAKFILSFNLFNSSYVELMNGIDENEEETYRVWLKFIESKDRLVFESEFCLHLEKRAISFETSLSIYEDLKEKANLQHRLFLWIITQKIVSASTNKSIFFEVVTYFASIDFERAYSYFILLAKEPQSPICRIALENLQIAFLNSLRGLVQKEDWEKAWIRLEQNKTLFEEVVAFKPLAEFVTDIIERGYYYNLSKINQLIHTIDDYSFSIEMINLKVHGNVFSLSVMNRFFNESILCEVIRDFKKNREKPFLEFLLILRILETVYEKKFKLNLETTKVIDSFIRTTLKSYASFWKAEWLEYFLGDESLGFAITYLLENTDRNINDLIKKIDGKNDSLFRVNKATLRVFFTKITNDLYSIEDEKLFEFFQTFKQFLDNDLIEKILRKLASSNDLSILKEVLSYHDKRSLTINFESIIYVYLKSLLNLNEYDLYFNFIRTNVHGENYLDLFIQYKHTDTLPFYQKIIQQNLLDKILPLMEMKDLLDDIKLLIDLNLDVAKTIFFPNFTFFLKEEIVEQVLKIVLEFSKSENELLVNCQQKCIKYFSFFSEALLKKKNYKEWCELLSFIPAESFPKIVTIVQSSLKKILCFLLEHDKDNSLSEVITYLLQVKLIHPKFLSLWHKKKIIELTEYFLENLFTHEAMQEIAISFAKMLLKENYSLSGKFCTDYLNCEEEDKAFIYGYLTGVDQSILNDIYKKIIQDEKKLFFVFDYLNTNCQFFQFPFSYKVIDKEAILLSIKQLMNQNLTLGIQLMVHSETIENSLVDIVLENCELGIGFITNFLTIGCKNIANEKDLSSFHILCQKLISKVSCHTEFILLILALLENLSLLLSKQKISYTQDLQKILFLTLDKWLTFKGEEIVIEHINSLKLFFTFLSFEKYNPSLFDNYKKVFIKKILLTKDSVAAFTMLIQIYKAFVIVDEKMELAEAFTLYGLQLHRKCLLFDDSQIDFLLDELKGYQWRYFYKLFLFADFKLPLKIVTKLWSILINNLPNCNLCDLEEKEVKYFKKSLKIFIQAYSKEIIKFYDYTSCLEKVFTLLKPLGEEFSYQMCALIEKEILSKKYEISSTSFIDNFHSRNNALNHLKNIKTFDLTLHQHVYAPDKKGYFVNWLSILQIGFPFSQKTIEAWSENIYQSYKLFINSIQKINTLDSIGLENNQQTFINFYETVTPCEEMVNFFKNSPKDHTFLVSFLEAFLEYVNKIAADEEVYFFTFMFFFHLYTKAFPKGKSNNDLLLKFCHSWPFYHSTLPCLEMIKFFCAKMQVMIENDKNRSRSDQNYIAYAYYLNRGLTERLNDKTILLGLDYLCFLAKREYPNLVIMDERIVNFLITLSAGLSKFTIPISVVNYYYSTVLIFLFQNPRMSHLGADELRNKLYKIFRITQALVVHYKDNCFALHFMEFLIKIYYVKDDTRHHNAVVELMLSLSEFQIQNSPKAFISHFFQPSIQYLDNFIIRYKCIDYNLPQRVLSLIAQAKTLENGQEFLDKANGISSKLKTIKKIQFLN